jgi:nucleoside-diphosphate-sugar epimerase
MKILITGAAGFLGYHLTHYLIDRGEEVLGLDIAEFPSGDYPATMKKYQIDVRDQQKLRELIEKENPQMIVHAAAALPLWSKKDIFTTNGDGTRNVLEAAYQNNIERVVFISSTAVYGVPKVHPILEEHPLVGVGPYGESKILAEKVCEEYRSKGLCVPIIRPKTFIGPARLGVFEILFDWVHDHKKIPAIGNGKNRYQLLDVSDLCEAIYLTLTKEEKLVNDVFNVGAMEFSTMREDLESFFKKVGSKSRVISTPAGLLKFVLAILFALKLSPLYKWVYDTADKDSFVATTKIQQQLGWKAKYSNQDAFLRAYQWYLEHYEEIKQAGVGVTHRKAWKQGILKLVKKFM